MRRRRPDREVAVRDAAPGERWQHGAEPEVVAAGRQQVARPVLALRRSGKVGDAEVAAAERYYADYALALCGARDMERIGAGGGVQAFFAATVDAVTRYREAAQAIGPRGDALLRLVVVEEMSCTALGARLGTNHHDAGGRVATVLEVLADHYAAVDRKRSAPVTIAMAA